VHEVTRELQEKASLKAAWVQSQGNNSACVWYLALQQTASRNAGRNTLASVEGD